MFECWAAVSVKSVCVFTRSIMLHDVKAGAFDIDHARKLVWYNSLHNMSQRMRSE